MEQTDKKQSMDIANAPLDTNTLRPIGYPFDEEKDDSFAAEFERYIHKEADRIIQEEKDRSFERGRAQRLCGVQLRRQGAFARRDGSVGEQVFRDSAPPCGRAYVGLPFAAWGQGQTMARPGHFPGLRLYKGWL